MPAVDRTFRVVEEDVNTDGRPDLTFYGPTGPMATIYGWKSLIASWAVSTLSLVTAGLVVIQFW